MAGLLIAVVIVVFAGVLVAERRAARREVRRTLLALEEITRAEHSRFRAEYAREFQSLREDNARAFLRLQQSVDERLERFITELLEISEATPDAAPPHDVPDHRVANGKPKP